MDDDRQEITWQAYEYRPKTPRADIFWILTIIAGGAAAAAVILKNYLFAVVILVGTFVILLFSFRRPDLVTFTLNDRGLRINRTFRPFKEFKSFWIEADEHHHRILLTPTNRMGSLLTIPFHDEDHEIIRAKLSAQLPEVETEEPLTDRILDILGF